MRLWICEPTAPFFAAPTANPSRAHILLFPWLDENAGRQNTVETEARGTCVSWILSSLLWSSGLTTFKHFPGSWIKGSQRSSARATLNFSFTFPALLGSPVAAVASWLLDLSGQVSVLQLPPDDPTHPLRSDIFIFPLSLQLCPAVGRL